ncbi:virion morphogenesis protein [Chitinimonas prasina]|uniref:Virion morphogenesis protein n=1 Tax=Chitinimonas prasina TaxID=1434937 RepID=A0ABQ5YFJ1_9NEIS|nr:phage virion morphogenesis protein [Chitinimonas prasina]GLR13258.1 virion morphogenesis protein [Chitinimonas prasina]
MAELTELTAWCDGLLASLESSQRRQLARQIAQELRTANAKRIAGQVTPDGEAFEPRKVTPKFRKQGHIRRGLFSKLRTARFFKAEAGPDGATVGFGGRVGRIARVHHYGLRDRVRPGGPEHQYTARPLLGVTDEDIESIKALVLASLIRM